METAQPDQGTAREQKNALWRKCGCAFLAGVACCAAVALVIAGYSAIVAAYRPENKLLVEAPVGPDRTGAGPAATLSLMLPRRHYACSLAVAMPDSTLAFEATELRLSVEARLFDLSGNETGAAHCEFKETVTPEVLLNQSRLYRENAALAIRQPDTALPWPMTNAVAGIERAVFPLMPLLEVKEDGARVELTFHIEDFDALPAALREAQWFCRIEPFIDAM